MTEKQYYQEKTKGCRKVFIAIIIIILFLIGLAFLMDKPSQLEKWFKENDLGFPKVKSEETWSNGKILEIESSSYVRYKVYLTLNEELYQIFLGSTKAYPIYSLETNDLVLDYKEKEIIENSKKFMNYFNNNTSIKILNEDIKTKLNFPNTFKHIETSFFDLGNKYIINIKFKSKNMLNTEIINVAKYKYDLETGKYTFIEII